MSKTVIRAGVTKVLLAHRARLAPGELRRFERGVGRSLIETIDQALNLAWIPGETHVLVLDKLRDTVGSEGVREYFAAAYLEGFSQLPLLENLIQGTLRALGASPGHLAKIMPRAWGSLAKDAGAFETTVHDREAVLVFEGLDPGLAKSGSFADSFAGTFIGFIRQCEVEGTVEVESLETDRGAARFKMRWG